MLRRMLHELTTKTYEDLGGAVVRSLSTDLPQVTASYIAQCKEESTVPGRLLCILRHHSPHLGSLLLPAD